MKRVGIVSVITLSLAIAAGSAWAYFPSTGSGTGTASVTSMQSVAISSVTATPSTPLLPGTSGDLTFRIDNPNSVAVTIMSVVSNGAITASGAGGCTGANSAVTFSNQTGLSVNVPASAVHYVVDLSASVFMASTSSNSCQNATLNVPVLVTVNQG